MRKVDKALRLGLSLFAITKSLFYVKFEESSAALHFCTPLHFWMLTSASASAPVEEVEEGGGGGGKAPSS